jgi:hypothetical protein
MGMLFGALALVVALLQLAVALLFPIVRWCLGKLPLAIRGVGLGLGWIIGGLIQAERIKEAGWMAGRVKAGAIGRAVGRAGAAVLSVPLGVWAIGAALSVLRVLGVGVHLGESVLAKVAALVALGVLAAFWHGFAPGLRRMPLRGVAESVAVAFAWSLWSLGIAGLFWLGTSGTALAGHAEAALWLVPAAAGLFGWRMAMRRKRWAGRRTEEAQGPRDYYAELGVEPGATASRITEVYRRMAMIYHPDLNPGDRAAEAKMKQINASYEVLKDEGRRKAFDAAIGLG